MQRFGPWTRLSSKVKYKNSWISIQEDRVIQPDGSKGVYAYLRKVPGIFVVAFTGTEVYLLRQFRYVLRKSIYEIPAGTVNSKNFLQVAKRELFEETGMHAKQWTRLGKHYIAPGHESTCIITYLAEGLDEKSVSIDGQEGDESIQAVMKVSLPKLWKMIHEGKIECGLTLAALNYFFSYLRVVRKQKI